MNIKRTGLFTFILLFSGMALLVKAQNPVGSSGFIAYRNQGQWAEKILYKADLKGGALFFHSNSVALQLSDPEGLQHNNRSASGLLRMHGLKMEFPGSNPQADVTGTDAHPVPRNYFTGNDPSAWQSGVKGYQTLRMHNLYPGIDVLWNESEGHVKYTVELERAELTSQYSWKYTGADSLRLRPSGSLEIYTSVRTITEMKPVAWQWVKGKKINIPVSFTLKGDTLGFQVKHAIVGLPLTIDPVLIFSTYTGSVADNFGFTATYDQSGNLYAGGRVYSAGYPVFGPYQGTFQGVFDVGISKFNSNGTQMLFSTYLGGSDQEQPHSLVVNSRDELLVMGTTRSVNFPVLSAVQPAHAGEHDIFITMFNAAGDQLLASTYLGGNQEDGFNGFGLDYNYGDNYRGEIIVDDRDQIYIASNSGSGNFPASAGSIQTTLSGQQDGVVAKFSSTLQTLHWASYLGGSHSDAAYGLKCDSAGNVYITGGTLSQNFPVSGNAYRLNNAGNIDGFVSKISADGSQLMYSTYLGTAGTDQSYFIQLDQEGHVYLYGQSTGNMPVINSPIGAVYTNPSGKQFILCLDSTLNLAIMGTVFGAGRSGPDISPTAFLVDNCGSIYCSGWAASFQNVINPSNTLLNTSGLPVTGDAIKATTNGIDFYLVVFRHYASALEYGTFLGGNESREHVDGGTSRFSPDGIVYHAVCAGCGGNSDFPVTAGVVGPANNSNNCNLAAFKLDFEPKMKADFTYISNSYCPPYLVQFQYQGFPADAYHWKYGNNPGDTSVLKNPAIIFPESGNFPIQLIATEFTCMGTDTVIKNLSLNPRAFADRTFSYNPCNPYISLQYTGEPADSVVWVSSTGEIREGTFAAFLNQGEVSIVVTLYAYKEHCTDTITDSFSFASAPPVSFRYILDTCTRNVQFFSDVPDSFQMVWNFGDGNLSEEKNPFHEFPEIGKYKVSLMVIGDSCNSQMELEINLAVESDKKIFIPNVFTPNGDGFFDEFEIELQNHDNFSLTILDRWGNLMYHSLDPKVKWNGQRDGKQSSEGTYFYVITTRSCTGDPIEIQGHVSLLR